MNPDTWSLEFVGFWLLAVLIIAIVGIIGGTHYLIFDRWRWTRPKS